MSPPLTIALHRAYLVIESTICYPYHYEELPTLCYNCQQYSHATSMQAVVPDMRALCQPPSVLELPVLHQLDEVPCKQVLRALLPLVRKLQWQTPGLPQGVSDLGQGARAPKPAPLRCRRKGLSVGRPRMCPGRAGMGAESCSNYLACMIVTRALDKRWSAKQSKEILSSVWDESRGSDGRNPNECAD
jgi:hypothetical protein